MNNNVIVNADTDSIMIARPDGSPWTKEDQQAFLDSLNAQFPEKISFAHDGYYDKVLVVASKNYALLLNKDFAKKKDLNADGTLKLKTKGSSIRDQKKEPAMREMMDKIIEAMIYDRQDTLMDIYKTYVAEALNVQDINRWSQKKSLSDSILKCKGYTEKDMKSKENPDGLRKNETVVWDAIANEEGMQQGDKFYIYPVILETKIITSRMGKPNKNGISRPLKDQKEVITGLKLSKYWKQDQDVEKLINRCYDTLEIFEEVLDTAPFLEYTNKTIAQFLEAFK